MKPTPPAQLRCADGRYVNAQANRVPLRRFPDLVAWMEEYGLADDLADERYASPKGIKEHAAHIDAVIARFVAHLPQAEVAHGGQARQFNWGAVRAPDELIDDGHLADRGFWVDVEHPELGRSFKYPGAAAIHNGSPWRISRRAPLIGEHNRVIYGKELGLKDAELSCLMEAGVI